MRGRLGRTCVLALAGAIAWTGLAQAKTFEVTKRGDPVPDACKRNDCSLREAVLAANERAGSDRILLPSRKKAYRLAIPNEIPGVQEDGGMTGDLDVSNDPLSIRHPGKGKATIRGTAGLGDRLFELFAPLKVSKLKLTGGNAQNDTGGAFEAAADLTISRSTAVGNRSQGVGGVVDMEDDAALRIVRSALVRNESNNTSGAIRSDEGPITIIGSVLRGNRTPGDGGAMRISNSGPVKILRTTISGNRAGEDGGGVQVSDPESLTIRGSTIAGNVAEADGGGLFVDDGSVNVVNSTIAGNRALDFGGGVFVGGAGGLQLNAVTIARNHGSADDEGALAPGGGIFRNTTGTVSVRNTIIALNRLGADPIRSDCGGEAGQPFDSLGNNLLSTLAPPGVCNGFDGPADRIRSNPKIGKLRRNGGPTKTVALRKGSAAINKAHKPSSPNRDQRGVKRKNPDIGAFERR